MSQYSGGPSDSQPNQESQSVDSSSGYSQSDTIFSRESDEVTPADGQRAQQLALDEACLDYFDSDIAKAMGILEESQESTLYSDVDPSDQEERLEVMTYLGLTSNEGRSTRPRNAPAAESERLQRVDTEPNICVEPIDSGLYSSLWMDEIFQPLRRVPTEPVQLVCPNHGSQSGVASAESIRAEGSEPLRRVPTEFDSNPFLLGKSDVGSFMGWYEEATGNGLFNFDPIDFTAHQEQEGFGIRRKGSMSQSFQDLFEEVMGQSGFPEGQYAACTNPIHSLPQPRHSCAHGITNEARSEDQLTNPLEEVDSTTESLDARVIHSSRL